MPFNEVVLNDGNKMPTIAFGTGSKWKGHDVTTLVEQALESGFSHVDTAAVYQTEQYVATAIRESGLSRSEFFVTTKYSRYTAESLPEGIQQSLQNLELKQVDLYLIHSPMNVPNLQTAWKEMETIQAQGLARSIGVSNYLLKDLETTMVTAKVTPAVNQISLNPYNYTAMKSTIDYCKKHGIVVEAYSSLAPITRYPGGPVDVPLKAAAKRLGITPTQAIFLWLRAKGIVTVTTTSKKDHMEEYLAVGDLDSLTEEEVLAIDKAGVKGPPSLVRVALRRGYDRATASPTKALFTLGVASFMMYQGLRLW
ncbi:Aldo/keto reductase [Dendrothele bispora CBS 962.96]|uniref:Aldo/keto reductase n=1 Tax=Dendrothele bispora (strain CBS 962.96) TaxID=1314807 RepID=A0A4S8LNF1_DENBC|nr:Aldo/keto reductase [Dendrothele bispora CBS 962.96]